VIKLIVTVICGLTHFHSSAHFDASVTQSGLDFTYFHGLL